MKDTEIQEVKDLLGDEGKDLEFDILDQLAMLLSDLKAKGITDDEELKRELLSVAALNIL